MSDLTVVYYTSNSEDAEFERRVRMRLLEVAGHLPIVAVSQKPLLFGQNICVGEVGSCDANAFRQLQIGALAAATSFIAVAEADCLYPSAYFEFEPPALGECYRYRPVYILWRKTWNGSGGFRRKEWTEGAQIVDRDYLLRQLEKVLAGRPVWSEPAAPSPSKPIFAKRSWWYFDGPPMISVKTGRGLRSFTGTVRGEAPVDELPLWGSAQAVRKELFL